MELFVYLLLGVSCQLGHALEDFLAEPPSHVVAIQGDNILFNCVVGPHVTQTLSWKDIDTGNFLTKGPGIDPGQNFDKSTRDRFKLFGDRANGEYHLQIRGLVGDDGGRYACYYYDEATATDIHSTIVTLSVMTPPHEGYPRCSTEPEFTRLDVGDNITLVCESRGGNPPAALTWIRERDIVNVRYTPNNIQPINKISFVLTEQDKDKKFVCLARNPATKQPISCSVKPLRSSIGLRITPPTMRANPGSAATFNCISEPVPGLVYTWYVNDQRVDGSHARFSDKRGGRRLKIYPVLPEDDFTLVTCVVEQPDVGYELAGSATALFWVNIEDHPDFVWTTTPTPKLTAGPTKGYNRLPSKIYNNIDKTVQPVATTEENIFYTTTPPVQIQTTKPRGIHENSEGKNILDIGGITFDVNELLETLIDPDLNEPMIPEREPTVTPATFPTWATTPTTIPFSENITLSTENITDSPTDNSICSGGKCTVGKTTQTKVSDNEIDNGIAKMVTPPNERFYQNDGPISSDQQSSKGLAVGLSLGLIFLALIVLIIAFMVWRNRNTKEKEHDKEKQKPAAKKTTK
ncbi:uncharacterized protein [Amphiura filiformis]|uniref:uncharacterized protein n=1 Tax=Amphiura filiformis TaxID=82378 RepID=UPI003B20D0F8